MNNYSIKISILSTLFIVLILTGLQSMSLADEGKTIDDQTKEISYLLMCPVCQGQSVGESNSNLAHDMRDIVRKQLEQGKSKEEILAYFVNSYGESILASPPPKGINWLLWLLPGVGIITGGIIITLFLFKAQRDDKNEDSQEIKTQPKMDNEYLNRIEEELKDNDS
ncbi:MAG: cytochrome C-type biogenesis protein [Thermodesulfobacteriota bacterium]|nr:MAG: cytochrome C-type biogenesis protein [Thermodesulfobacteriota bacterium]